MKLLNAISAKLILLLLVPLLYILFPSVTFAQMVPGGTTIFSDNFTDANGTSLSTHNSTWRITEGSAQIENNQLVYQYPYFRGSIPTYTTDQCVSFDLQFPTTGRNEIWLRAADSPDTVQNGYYIRLDNNGSNYDFAVADMEGTLSGFSFPSSVTSGMHNYKGCIIGNQISVYLDNVSLGSGTVHNDFSNGYPRIGGNSGNIIDNYVYTGVVPATPTPTPVVQVNANPSTASVTVGSPFTVNVTVNSTGEAFNAAGSTVTVSPNLTVTGIKSPNSNSCNFDFTKTPTTSNPSFAGGIYGTSSTGCTAYTMVITPTSVGTGTITFTNSSVKAYADSSEIITGVQNGSFTINPAPTPTGATTQTIDDSIQGTGQNQWNYVGSGWGHCTSCNDTATFYNASQSWDNSTNDYVTMQFTGEQFNLYGGTDPKDGIGAVSIDGGSETNVDFYSATRTGNLLLWTSPVLSNSTHTIKLRVTGTHDSSATDNYLILDRGDILATPSLPNLSVNTYPTDTYNSSLTINGTKDSSITTVFVNGSSANVTYPTSTTWQAVLSLPMLGNTTFAIYGADSQNNQTATTSITIKKHTLGDINGDGNIDLIDASLFAVDYGKTNPSTFVYPLSDMNGDGNVDLTDLSILAKLEQ